MRTVKHPWEERGPNMFAGFDADGNRIALDFVDDDNKTLKDILHYHMADAARYRWLRANAKEIVFGATDKVTCYGSIDDNPESLDVAIDAAMKSGTNE